MQKILYLILKIIKIMTCVVSLQTRLYFWVLHFSCLTGSFEVKNTDLEIKLTRTKGDKKHRQDKAWFHADREEFNSALQTPTFNMNEVAKLGIRTLSQTVHPCENQPTDRRRGRGNQRITCKTGKHMGHAWQRLTTATVRHASNAAAWCWDHV